MFNPRYVHRKMLRKHFSLLATLMPDLPEFVSHRIERSRSAASDKHKPQIKIDVVQHRESRGAILLLSQVGGAKDAVPYLVALDLEHTTAEVVDRRVLTNWNALDEVVDAWKWLTANVAFGNLLMDCVESDYTFFSSSSAANPSALSGSGLVFWQTAGIGGK